MVAHPSFLIEYVELASLQAHPRNYQKHPPDELEHIMESIRTHGFYRNIIISQDTFILARHGVVLGAMQLDYTHGPALRVPYPHDDPRALKILAGDNEIRHLAEVDDRSLSELLKEIALTDTLLGTGYDEMMLATLAMVTRPTSEIANLDAAAHWVGLPGYEDKGEDHIQIIVNFACEDDRREFCRLLSLDASKIALKGTGSSLWWPNPRAHMDSKSLHFVSKGSE